MPRPWQQRTQPALTVALLAAAAVGLVVHSLRFNFVTDDAFISFVYARNLVEHGQLVFNLGERVEGYTNFLWTLLVALGLALRVPAELSARVLGTLCGAATLAVCALAHRRLREPRGPLRPSDAVPALYLAALPGYACWSSGGLETQLFALLCTLGGALYLRDRGAAAAAGGGPAPGAAASLAFGLAALTRPEGLLFFGLTAVHAALGRALTAARGDGQGRRGPLAPLLALWPPLADWRAMAPFFALVVPHLLFRRLYYGYWVPNTFYIKSSGVGGAWAQGGYYLLLFCQQQKAFLLPLLALLGLLPRAPEDARRRLAGAVGYVGLLSAVFLLYVAAVGGDFMGLHRFLMPIVPLSALVGSLGLLRLLVSARVPGGGRLLVLVALLGLHSWNSAVADRRALTFIGADRGIDTPGYLRYYTEDRAAIGRWLGQHAAPDDYQVVGGAGAQVYYARIRALDSFGLSDAYVAHEVPAVSSRPGHQKFAPLSYVLSRNPTILTYNVYRIDDRPYRPSPEEARSWRARGFHYVSVQIPGLSRPYYSFLKRVDRRLGPLPPAEAEEP